MIWRDGELLDEEPTCTPGDEVCGVFTTAGCDGAEPVLWPQHLQRLRASLRALDPEVELNLPGVEAMRELLVANSLHTAARLRLVAWRSVRGWCLEATVAELCEAGPDREPAALEVVRWHEAPRTAGHKVVARKAWDEAGRRVRSAGADDALLVDDQQQVLETSVANLWAVLGDSVITPPAPRSCLPGIMRAWLLEHLHRIGLQASEAPLPLHRLLGADELWISNAVIGLRRVGRVTERAWSAWPCFERLNQLPVPAPGWHYSPDSGSM